MTELSIIITSYKNAPILRMCLKSIKDSVKDLDYEIIVVDSQTTEETRDVVIEEFPEIKLLPFVENTGYSKAVNAGIKASSGEYILILNPDIVVFDDSIAKLINALEQDSDIGLVGPALLGFNKIPQQSCFRYYTPLTILCRRTFVGKLPFFKKKLEHFLMQDKNLKQSQEVNWVQGSAMMIPRKVIEKVGLMDESFFMYFEDVDWCKNFWDNGLKVVYFPDAKMYHYHQRKSSRGLGILDLFLGRESRWHLQSGLKFFLKHGFFAKSS